MNDQAHEAVKDCLRALSHFDPLTAAQHFRALALPPALRRPRVEEFIEGMSTVPLQFGQEFSAELRVAEYELQLHPGVPVTVRVHTCCGTIHLVTSTVPRDQLRHEGKTAFCLPRDAADVTAWVEQTLEQKRVETLLCFRSLCLDPEGSV